MRLRATNWTYFAEFYKKRILRALRITRALKIRAGETVAGLNHLDACVALRLESDDKWN
jgi:hypothetical protein